MLFPSVLFKQFLFGVPPTLTVKLDQLNHCKPTNRAMSTSAIKAGGYGCSEKALSKTKQNMLFLHLRGWWRAFECSSIFNFRPQICMHHRTSLIPTANRSWHLTQMCLTWIKKPVCNIIQLNRARVQQATTMQSFKYPAPMDLCTYLTKRLRYFHHLLQGVLPKRRPFNPI